ncbi:MAG: SDR family NAD(P)-dependent oxidoreductase [Leptolyngbyaceae cyanobacterium RM2_2_4]|nr:SDR family NAD(P)-dependent oxidoreductase [Leptolyngbyaceae cyanobacterium SM1_4_3]NJN90715.1 SDR family NAD(P)-dependent oxidoreductase [Leptolyngbyaceae cyanobacterium SL_5_14]NJO49254.1 SDR family NAD(P)-dependent oxidoreductase [Leptolyngbyaceae cyanobacterium RM2_2_4]
MKAIANQTILITGSTDGIGKQTAHDLAKMGATVLLHGRSREKAESVLDEIQLTTGNNKLKYYLADLSSLTEVRRLSEAVRADHKYLDVLINNAGIGTGKRTNTTRELSQDGYELRFAVNYLAPFLLTHLLLPSLRHITPTRIVNVASVGQSPLNFDDVMLEQQYDPMKAYCQSKLALIMFTFDLAEQLKHEQITVNSLHPGSRLDTKMVREMFDSAWGNVQSGVDAVVYVATAPELESVTGKYFDQKDEEQAIAQAYDCEAQTKLWRLSETLTKLSVLH